MPSRITQVELHYAGLTKDTQEHKRSLKRYIASLHLDQVEYEFVLNEIQNETSDVSNFLAKGRGGEE